jgi:hypothetical protein
VVADTIESGPDRPPRRPLLRRPAVGLVAAALLVGAVAGYFVGDSHGKVARPTPSAGPSAGAASLDHSPALADIGIVCSSQVGRTTLQLGVRLDNESAVEVTLRRLEVTFPLGGMKLTSSNLGACGQQVGLVPVAGAFVPPGGYVWLAATVEVQVACPAPLPVQLTVFYVQSGLPPQSLATGFPDLGHVPYSGCHTG